MNWKLIQWWVSLSFRNKIAVGVVVIILGLWVAFTRSGIRAMNEKDALSVDLKNCNQEKVNITERLKDQVISLQQENQSYERKELERLRAQNEYRDSINNMFLLTRRKAEKAIENAKK